MSRESSTREQRTGTDFPGFYELRPLWDVVVVVLSLGGLVLAGTTLLPGWRRAARLLRRTGG